MIVLFFFHPSKEPLQHFVDDMNKQHKCIKLTSEKEHNNSFLFLDIKVTRHDQQFKTSVKKTFVKRKPTFSGVFLHYESYLDQPKSLIDTLVFHCSSTCSDYTLICLELENLR